MVSGGRCKKQYNGTNFLQYLEKPRMSNDAYNVLPLIYDEKARQCNIMVFDYDKAKKHTSVIKREDVG